MELKDDQIKLNNDTTVKFKFSDKAKANCTISSGSDRSDKDVSIWIEGSKKKDALGDH